MNVLKLLPLMGKYGQLTPGDITIDVAKDIADALGYKIPIDDGMLQAIVGTLAEDDIDKLADIASHPAVITKVVSILTGNNGDDESFDDSLNVIPCPHCGEYLAL